MENPTSLRNLSLALRHILQQFMDSNKSGEHKNADMTLPHNGYFQRLSWYFECDHCHYRTFYVREIEAHRQICSIANGVSTSHVTIPKCENTSAVAATTPVLNGGTGEQDPMSIQSPVMLDGLALSSIDNPLAQTTDASASLVNDTDTAFAISPDVKQELRRYLGASGVETPLQNNSAVINKPKRRRSRKSQVNKRGSVSSQFLNAVSTPKPSTSGCQPSAAATQNTWEEIEQIFVSAEGEGQESLNRSGRSRKRKVGSCQRWSKEENAIMNALHDTPSEMPSREVMDKLCEALPGRSKCVIRAKASNTRKLLLKLGLDRFPDEPPMSPEVNLASPDQLSDAGDAAELDASHAVPSVDPMETTNHMAPSASVFPDNNEHT